MNPNVHFKKLIKPSLAPLLFGATIIFFIMSIILFISALAQIHNSS